MEKKSENNTGKQNAPRSDSHGWKIVFSREKRSVNTNKQNAPRSEFCDWCSHSSLSLQENDYSFTKIPQFGLSNFVGSPSITITPFS